MKFASVSKLNGCLTLLLLVVSAMVGCDRDPMIRVYEVDVRKPAEGTGSQNPTASDLAAKPKRMLGAIIPIPKQSIFLKLTGEPNAVMKLKEDFASITKSLTAKSGGDVDFQVPKGWKREAGNGMASAIVVPPSLDGLDGPLTVTPLTRPEDVAGWDAHVQQNLDRWRGQVGLSAKPVDQQVEPEIQTLASSIEGLSIYLINYEGKATASAGMPPFMRGGMGQPPIAPVDDIDPPASSPAPSKETTLTKPTTSSAAAGEATKVNFNLPDGWVDKSGASSSMRLVSLRTGPSEDAADISVIMAGGDERNIVELWAKSVMGADSDVVMAVDQILQDAKIVKTAGGLEGKSYWVVDSREDTDQPEDKQAIYAAVFPVDSDATEGQRTYVKMSGPAVSVKANVEKFESFVESLNW